MKGRLAMFLLHLYECFVHHDTSFVVAAAAAAIEFREMYACYKIYSIETHVTVKQPGPGCWKAG